MEVIHDLYTGSIKPMVFADLQERVGTMHGRASRARHMVEELEKDLFETIQLKQMSENHKCNLVEKVEKLTREVVEETEDKEKFARLTVHLHGRMKSMEAGLTKACGDLDEEKLITCALEEKIKVLESGNAECIIIFPGDGVLRGSMHESFGIKEMKLGIEFLKDSIKLEQLSEGKKP